MSKIFNVEAEVSILGSILVDGTLFKGLILEEKHFSQVHHRLIFQAMTEVSKADRFIHIITVAKALKDNFYQAGGVDYLFAMAKSITSTTLLKRHEESILCTYRRRKSRDYALKFAENPTNETLDQLIKNLQACREVQVRN